MAKGSSSRSGPAPDVNALRRDRDSGDWVELPESGRDGPTPDWPLPNGNDRERELWEAEWRRPQAVMWEQAGRFLEVALYVRNVTTAEQANAPIAARSLVLRHMEELGISQTGLNRARWRIGPVEAPKQAPKPRKAASERLKVIQGGG